jgi:acyl phosphate:glycerol-3-phosphate acyltransferase
LDSLILPVVVGYLLGSIPFGMVLTRLAGLGDIRHMGSGNIGATNVLRTGSKKIAALTLFLDGGKGALAVLLFAPESTGVAMLAGGSALLGHIFPIWLKFKGGKGVATALGILLAATFNVGALACLTWLIVAFFTRYSSLAALIAVALAPYFAWALDAPDTARLAVFIAPIVWIRHLENLRRLHTGDETKIGAPSSTDSPSSTDNHS